MKLMLFAFVFAVLVGCTSQTTNERLAYTFDAPAFDQAMFDQPALVVAEPRPTASARFPTTGETQPVHRSVAPGAAAPIPATAPAAPQWAK